MFAFTKEQRQAKLARTNVDNYNKLELSLSKVTDSLQREAISNAMTDIVDIFTMLRSTYELYKPVRTTEDYRLLRVPVMPGIVLNYRWIANDLKNEIVSYYQLAIIKTNHTDLQTYLVKALVNREHSKMKKEYELLAEKYSITNPFSPKNYNTALNLLNATLNHRKKEAVVVTDCYDREVCEQFAHNQNIDILISI